MQSRINLRRHHTSPRPVRRLRSLVALGAAVLLFALLSVAGRPTPALAASWVPDSSGTTEHLLHVDCLLPSFCKAVGYGGTILSWNGTSWSADVSGTMLELHSVDCLSISFCKAVGQYGTVRTFNGIYWYNDVFGGVGAHLVDVACLSPFFCKAAGSGGAIFSWDGTSWSAEDSSVSENVSLSGVDCVSTSFCKAVGRDGTALSWDGSNWSADVSGTVDHLFAVACLSPSFCKAVGDFGVILSWDGSGWSADPSGTMNSLGGVACLSPSFCKAVGLGSPIVSWDGTSWSTDVSGTGALLFDVACGTVSFCKAVGRDGTILSLAGGSDLAVTKSDAPDPVTAGANLTYMIAVTNTGPDAAERVELRDQVPAGTTFVSFSAPSGWTATTPPVGGTGQVTATRAMLAAGSGPQSFTLVVKVNAGRGSTTLSNTATVVAAGDPNPGNNAASTRTQVLAGTTPTPTPIPTVTPTPRPTPTPPPPTRLLPMTITGTASGPRGPVPLGTAVRAYVGSTPCGSSTATLLGAFVLVVNSATQAPGCGTPGVALHFQVGGAPATATPPVTFQSLGVAVTQLQPSSAP